MRRPNSKYGRPLPVPARRPNRRKSGAGARRRAGVSAPSHLIAARALTPRSARERKRRLADNRGAGPRLTPRNSNLPRGNPYRTNERGQRVPVHHGALEKRAPFAETPRVKFPRVPHSWRVTPKRAIALQRALAARVRLEPPRAPLRYLAGLDAAFSPDGKGCIAGVVLWDAKTQTVVEEHTAQGPLLFPYIPGLLSFREAPTLMRVLRRLQQAPDALMCDGQGMAHPRRLGIACHLGVICGLPSLGCAKSRLVGEHEDPPRRRGGQAALVDRDEVVGTVLRTQRSSRPVFVSVGHLMDLGTATDLVLASAGRGLTPTECRVLAEVGTSDHAPVVATFA